MPAPDLSLILVTRDGWATPRRALHYLAQQTSAARLELVVVAPARLALTVPPALAARFHSVQVVPIEVIHNREQAGAAGVRAAHAPVVVFVEDHVFPASDWAEALIAAHREQWAAVGPLVLNACPGPLALACHLADYAYWCDPAQPGPVPLLSNSNTSYKRDQLLALPGRLEDWLEAQPHLQAQLRAAGHQLLFEPRARLWHLNFSALGPWVRLRLAVGQSFGARRAQDWSAARRLIYLLAAPLIPLVNLRRLLHVARRTGAANAGTLGALVLLTLLEAFGEVAGYWLGEGAARVLIYDVEFDRPRFISARDRATLDATLARNLPAGAAPTPAPA